MRTLVRGCGLAAAGVLEGSAALAQPIPVLNHSFEQPAQTAGGFVNIVPPGWVADEPAGHGGVFYPTQGSWGYAAPHGNQVLFLNTWAVRQDVPAVAQAGQSYTLRVLVVHRPGFFSQTYSVRLMAGSTVLAEDPGSLTPPQGGALESVLWATIPAGSPAIGQAIRIRLSGATQTNFDNVRLDFGLPGCYANCDESSAPPVLNVNDFTCFLQKFAAGQAYANCDMSTTEPVLNVADFSCFLQQFAGGCP